MRQEVLRMDRVSLVEQGVVQLDEFTLNIFAGEIVGLLPVNNHGLTALLQLLQHNTPLRYGYVDYREKQVNTWRSSKYRKNRIALIQSESSLVEGLSVADNIFVLRPGFKTWIIRPSVLHKQLLPFLESVGIYISAQTYVSELSPFEKVVVDVLKSVMAGCKLIVLREIKTSICDAELQKIYRLLRHYAKQGISFLYIDFHFEELCQVCDRVALMSNGSVVKVFKGDAPTPEAFQIYTKAYTDKVKKQRTHVSAKTERRHAFEAQNVNGMFFNNLSFTAAAGECVVLQNENDQMLGELLSIITGETAQSSGKMLLDNKEIMFKSNRDIAIIQELPTRTMLFNELSYMDNLCFSLDHRLPEVWRGARVREGIRREHAPQLGEDVFDTRVDKLSEVQKYELIYTRVALQKPKVVFAVKPFRRADVELRMHIWELLEMLLDKGIGVVILAVNLADCMSLADKLIMLCKDRPNEVYTREEFSSMLINTP